MNVNLPTDLLRSFVAIVDAGSMSKAAGQICVTQSALSLQMRRLSELVQAPIFRRHHRGVLLADAGKSLLAYSRAILDLNDRALVSITGQALAGPIRIGMIQEFADGLLSSVLVRIMKINPGAELQIRVSGSAELLGQLSAGLLDLVLCLAEEDSSAAIISGQMEWFGDERLLMEPQLPVALMDNPCIFRGAALIALENSGIAYRIVSATNSMSVLRAAVRGGVAVTCRTRLLIGDNATVLEGLRLPLPQVAYCVHIGADPHPFVDRVAQTMRNALLGESGLAQRS
jgi:DNA-binding transcriptional LysR family regulator